MTNGTRKYTILVVDDEAALRELAATCLNNCAVNAGLNLKVLQAYDGANAIELMIKLQAEGRTLDGILSDWDMPNGTGLVVLEKGRELFPGANYAIWSARWSGKRDEAMNQINALSALAIDKPATDFEAFFKDLNGFYFPSPRKA